MKHIEILEQIESSVKFYEKDKPEFVETLQHAIQVLERLEDRRGIEKILDKHNVYRQTGDVGSMGTHIQKLAQALQDYLRGER